MAFSKVHPKVHPLLFQTPCAEHWSDTDTRRAIGSWAAQRRQHQSRSGLTPLERPRLDTGGIGVKQVLDELQKDICIYTLGIQVPSQKVFGVAVEGPSAF